MRATVNTIYLKGPIYTQAEQNRAIVLASILGVISGAIIASGVIYIILFHP